MHIGNSQFQIPQREMRKTFKHRKPQLWLYIVSHKSPTGRAGELIKPSKPAESLRFDLKKSGRF